MPCSRFGSTTLKTTSTVGLPGVCISMWGLWTWLSHMSLLKVSFLVWFCSLPMTYWLFCSKSDACCKCSIIFIQHYVLAKCVSNRRLWVVKLAHKLNSVTFPCLISLSQLQLDACCWQCDRSGKLEGSFTGHVHLESTVNCELVSHRSRSMWPLPVTIKTHLAIRMKFKESNSKILKLKKPDFLVDVLNHL